jgi:hypothetical protein
MPQARSMVASAPDRGVHAGGTSVGGGGGNAASWLFPVVGLVVVVVIVVFMVTRGEDKPAAEAPAPTKVSVPGEVPEPAEIPAEVVKEVDSAEDDADSLRADTAASVAKALERARLWSNVEVASGALVISSADCEAENMRQVLAANQALIEAAGFVMVRCLERHGALVFEDEVSAGPAAAQDQGGGGE